MIAWEWGQNKRQLNNWLKVPITIVPIEFKFKYKQYVHRVNFLICICRVLDDDDFSIEFVSTEKCGRTFWFLSSKRDDGGKLSSYKISTYSSSFSSFHSVLLLLLLYLSLCPTSIIRATSSWRHFPHTLYSCSQSHHDDAALCYLFLTHLLFVTQEINEHTTRAPGNHYCHWTFSS